MKSDNAAWLDPKWLVIASALAAFVVIIDYDHRLGIAAGILFAFTALIWIGIAMAFGAGGSPEGSQTRVLADRFERQVRRRIEAEQRIRELAARQPSGAQKAPDRP
jgi:hypothetical protein